MTSDWSTRTRVPFLDVSAAWRELREPLEAAFQRVMASGRYVLGEELTAFEQEWATYSGARYCVGVASGLDALALALRALGVGPGDEVLVPSNTYIATWLAVSRVGATVVPVEPDPVSHVVSVDAMRAAIGSRTAAMLPVHLYGLPVDALAMETLATDKHLALVFDAAQAHGATFMGRPLGSFGHACAWSFYPSKNLGAYGDAGAVTTGDEGLARRIARLRNYGSTQRYTHEERGDNSRLDELQAALLRVKLRTLDGWNARRAAHAARYQEALAHRFLQLPPWLPDRTAAWHLYVVQSADRDALQRTLGQRGVETLIHYPVPPNLQPAYGDLHLPREALPVAHRLATRVLSLPCGPHLTAADRERVIEALADLS